MTVGIEHFVLLSILLFVIGGTGVLIRRNILIILLSIEIMLNGALLAAIAFAAHHGVMGGQIFAIFVMALAAAEAGVALAVVLLVYRRRGTITSDEIDLMRR